ncbi:DUF4271 domain-containing protein [Labilibaculum sp.]|uniref:DUF4271 domain-containing protein n=1 Tax=Labilibaculum sp. TaxID=2060723 RepID=UPI003563C1ED
MDSLIETNNQSTDSSSLKLSNPIASTSVPMQKDTSLLFDPQLTSPTDSVAQADSTHTEQIFQGERGIPIMSYQNDWMVGVLLFALILLAILRFSFNKFLFRVLDSLLNSQSSSNLLLEKNMRNIRGSIFLNLLFYVNFSLFIIQFLVYILSLNQNHNNLIFYLYFFAGLICIYQTKFLFIRFIGYVFNGINESKEYLHTISIYNKNLGIFLLPITISVPFIAQYATPMLLKIGFALTLIFYFLRLFRGIQILFRQHVSIFYMISYLCALEILPLLMIYKLLYLLV